MRFDKDILTQWNGVTSYIGIQCMQRIIRDDYCWIHILDFQIGPDTFGRRFYPSGTSEAFAQPWQTLYQQFNKWHKKKNKKKTLHILTRNATRGCGEGSVGWLLS